MLRDRYRLGSVIGRGGMGVVWLATDELLGRKVAVKEVSYPPGLTGEERERMRRRTVREARTTARLSHHNVVGVYDIVEEDGRPWIVMEFVRSRSLGEIVRADGPLSPERTAEVGLQLLEALRAAHEAGILHRDVKPSNVLIGEDGRVVLGDFGIATAEDGSTVTSAGVLIGSPSYMAPERARSSALGPASDLWSLGATLYTAVEGHPPFDRENTVAILAAVVTEDPDPPRRAGPLWPLIRSLLQREPDARPGPQAIEDALLEIAGGAAPAGEEPGVRSEGPATAETAASEETTPVTAGRPRPGPVLAVAGLLVALAVLGLAVRWPGGGHPDARPSAAPSRGAAKSPSATPHKSPSPSPTAFPTASPSGDLPEGFHRYDDRTKFSIGVPDGWKTSHHGHYLYVEDPESSRLLIVDQTGTPKSDPLKDWRAQEKSRTGSYPGYHRVRLEKIDYPQAEKAADWEFTYNGSHGRTHILNRNILASAEHAYALYFSVPQSEWSKSQGVFDGFATSFRPAKA